MTHWRTPRCRSGSDLLSPTGLHGYKLAYFAIHRQTDPYPTVIDNVTAESLVVDAVVNAYGKRKPKKRKTT